MYIKAVLFVVFFLAFQCPFSSSLYLKRGDLDDPRLFSSSFGKRSMQYEPEREMLPTGQKYYAIRVQRRSDLDDPRFMTMSFGKRALLPSLADLHRYTIYDKRGADMDDPRFFSGAFGRK